MDDFYYEINFDDFESMTETVREWDFDISKLEKGNIRSKMSQIFISDMISASFYTNRTIKMIGAPPQGMWTFEITSPLSPPWLLGKNEVTNEAINIFRPGDDFSCVFKPGYDVYNFSLTPNDFQNYCQKLGIPDLVDALKSRDIILCPPGETKRIWHRINNCRNQCVDFNSRNIVKAAWMDCEMTLLEDILLTLAKGTSVRTNKKIEKRKLLLKKIEEYIKANSPNPITVRDLCKVNQVSERTLQYTFRSLVGITPKSYLKAIRLNGVRKELRTNHFGNRTINSIANKWGFWHMGQFAADYRRLFGELPSETLRK